MSAEAISAIATILIALIAALLWFVGGPVLVSKLSWGQLSDERVPPSRKAISIILLFFVGLAGLVVVGTTMSSCAKLFND